MPRSLTWLFCLLAGCIVTLPDSSFAKAAMEPQDGLSTDTVGLPWLGEIAAPGEVHEAPPAAGVLGMQVGPNLYAYVRQNPWTGWDPLGLATTLWGSTEKEEEPIKLHGDLRRPEPRKENLRDWTPLVPKDNGSKSDKEVFLDTPLETATRQAQIAKSFHKTDPVYEANKMALTIICTVGLPEGRAIRLAVGATARTAAKEAGAALVPRITEKGLVRIEGHLSRPGLEDIAGNSALKDPANARMIERLRSGKTTPQDINFYMHELKESAIMNRGVGPRDAHLQTLEWQGIPYKRGYESELYAPDAVELFNTTAK